MHITCASNVIKHIMGVKHVVMLKWVTNTIHKSLFAEVAVMLHGQRYFEIAQFIYQFKNSLVTLHSF